MQYRFVLNSWNKLVENIFSIYKVNLCLRFSSIFVFFLSLQISATLKKACATGVSFQMMLMTLTGFKGAAQPGL